MTSIIANMPEKYTDISSSLSNKFKTPNKSSLNSFETFEKLDLLEVEFGLWFTELIDC